MQRKHYCLTLNPSIMFQRFYKSILLAIFTFLCLCEIVVGCGDDENEENVQYVSSNNNADNGTSEKDDKDGTNGEGFIRDGQNKIYTVNGVSFKMIYVEGGTFQMGIGSEYDSTHEVTLSDYNIGETEVTQELWIAVMGNNPAYFIGDSQCPVECITWDECQNFISKLNKLTGETFLLPTEAQWEYAARGGNKSKGHSYSGGFRLENLSWYRDNSDGTTHRVKTKASNELGIYDMSGNVFEWCSDWHGSYSIYPTIGVKDPIGPATGSYRVRRGGSWCRSSMYCMVDRRGASEPAKGSYEVGFRLASL